MQTIKFKKEGILYHFHKFLYKKDPEDTCTYKRQLIITFIMCIVTLHTAILRTIISLIPFTRKDVSFRGIQTYFFLFALSILAILIGHILIEQSIIIEDFIYWSKLSTIELYLHSFIAFFMGAILVSLFALLGSFIIYIIMKIYERYFEYKSFSIVGKLRDVIDRDPETQVGVMYTSLKEKWCKKIDWKN